MHVPLSHAHLLLTLPSHPLTPPLTSQPRIPSLPRTGSLNLFYPLCPWHVFSCLLQLLHLINAFVFLCVICSLQGVRRGKFICAYVCNMFTAGAASGVCVYASTCVCVCECVCVCGHVFIAVGASDTCMHACTCVFVCVCVCWYVFVCVCVCV